MVVEYSAEMVMVVSESIFSSYLLFFSLESWVKSLEGISFDADEKEGTEILILSNTIMIPLGLLGVGTYNTCDIIFFVVLCDASEWSGVGHFWVS